MSTRKAIIEKAARRIGARYGAISSATSTTTVLGDLVNTAHDDFFNNWLLWRMEAATAADDERTVTDWADLTGTATVATQSDTTTTDEEYLLVPPGNYNLADWRQALDDMLLNTRRSVWNVTKTVADQLYYSMAGLTHVRTREDVAAVFRRNHTPTAAAGSFEAYDFTENYLRFPLHHKVIESGGVVYIELESALEADREIVVVTREPYSTLATDATSTTCPDSVAVPGLLYFLSRINRPNVDRERWDRIQATTGREYAMAARSLTQIPTPETQRRVVTYGA